MPSGFAISLVAAGLDAPRFMAFDPAGNLIVGSNSGSVYRLNGSNGSINPVPAPPTPLLSGLRAPHSVAFNDGYLYVAETDRIRRFPYSPGAALGSPETVVGDLPLVGEHFTRTVVFGADGKMYVGVGSSCNICVEDDPRRAAISQYNADGSGWVRFAWGARNAVGLATQPSTGLLWATVNERDYQGNEIPPDLVTIVRQGDNFGWPDCLPPNATPQDPGDNCTGITPPTVGIQAHAAPLGLAFYTGAQFPSDYQGDLFVVEHGSWNRDPPAPPKIVRVHFENGQPTSVRDFATGWQTDNKPTRWGRPVGIVVAPDGSLIVSDDQAGYIYRISYGGSS
jgi:glucose/arabinose dehydrogenase